MCDALGTAKCSVQIETNALRVTRWDFPVRGDNTGWHTHEFPYVVVPLFDGRLAITSPEGETASTDLAAGQSYSRPAGIRHDVASDFDDPVAFVEIEFLEGGSEGEEKRKGILYPM